MNRGRSPFRQCPVDWDRPGHRPLERLLYLGQPASASWPIRAQYTSTPDASRYSVRPRTAHGTRTRAPADGKANVPATANLKVRRMDRRHMPKCPCTPLGLPHSRILYPLHGSANSWDAGCDVSVLIRCRGSAPPGSYLLRSDFVSDAVQ